MIFRHHLSVGATSLPEDAFETICAIAPESRKPSGFRLQVDSESADGGEIIRRIIAVCVANGLKRERTYSQTSYGHHVDRGYGDELLRFEFLILTCRVIARTGVVDRRAVLAADPAYRLTSVLNFTRPMVVSDEVRRLLEGGILVGLEFGAEPLNPNPEYNWGRVPGPFWELKSSVVLPKMTNHLMQYGWRGGPPGPFEGDYSRPVFIDEPPFSRGEVHYRRSEIDALGSFDIARTFEKYMGPQPALVISRRFYRYCLANGIGVSVDPVHIDGE